MTKKSIKAAKEKASQPAKASKRKTSRNSNSRKAAAKKVLLPSEKKKTAKKKANSPKGNTKVKETEEKTGVTPKYSKTNLAAELLYGTVGKEYQLVNQRTNSVERVIDREEMESEINLRQNELRKQYNDATKLMEKVSRWIKQGFFGQNVGCTVAFRKKFGRIVSPLCYVIEVHVPFKVSDRNLDEWPVGGPIGDERNGKTYAVPKVVEGVLAKIPTKVLTKVIETQPYKTDAANLTSSSVPKSGVVRIKATKKLGDISKSLAPALSTTEIIGGLPTVESNQGNWGTFGIAYKESTGSKSFGLVNAHFAAGTMVQPPLKPTTTADVSRWEIGTVVSGKIFEGDIAGDATSEKFYVDAGLIALNDKRPFVLNLVHDFADEPFLYARTYLRHVHPNSTRRDVLKKVFKFGARTVERIEGFIENPEDTSVPMDGKLIGKVIRARRNGTGTFTIGGDSGSALIAPIFDLKTKRERFLVVGLCFAGISGDKETLYACQFAAVIKALGLKIPTDLLRDDWEYSKN